MDAQVNYHPATLEAAADRARQLARLDAGREPKLIGHAPNGDIVEIERLGPIVMADDRDPWERQPAENDQQWEAFTLYRDAPAGRRSVNAVWNVLHPDRQVGVVIPQAAPFMQAWSVEYRWSDRTVAYDIYQDQLYRQYLEGQRLAARVKIADLGGAMHKKAAEALAVYHAVGFQRIKTEDGGTKLVPRSNMTVSELVKLAETGVKLQRMALGEQDGAGPQVAVGVVFQVGDQELVEQARAVITARQGNPVTIDQL